MQRPDSVPYNVRVEIGLMSAKEASSSSVGEGKCSSVSHSIQK